MGIVGVAMSLVGNHMYLSAIKNNCPQNYASPPTIDCYYYNLYPNACDYLYKQKNVL